MRRLPRAALKRENIAPALLLCGLVLFVPNLRSYFISDDFVLLAATRVSSPAGVAGFFDPNTTWFYRPVVKVVYWLGQTLFGLHALPFHLLSLALHAANGWLVYRIAARHSSAGWAAGLIAGTLFLLNPHHAETVSWIAAVGDLLSTCLVLAALMLFMRFTRQASLRPLLASLALFAAALLTRETSVSLPGLLVLSLMLNGPSRHVPPRRLVWALSGYFALLVGYALLQSAGANAGAGRGALARGGLEFHPLGIESILLNLMAYVYGLVPGGEVLARLPLETQRVLVWFEWLLLLGLGWLVWRAGKRLMLFGLCWMLFTPVQFIFFSAPTDRYYYLPSIGFALFAADLTAGLFARAAGTRRAGLRRWLMSAAALLVALPVAGQGVALAGKVLDWRAAGRASGGVFNDLQRAAPSPRDYTAMYFVGLPALLNGVPAFQNGLPEAVALLYDNPTLAASATTCADLRGRPELPRYNLIFRFKGDGLEKLPSERDCRD